MCFAQNCKDCFPFQKCRPPPCDLFPQPEQTKIVFDIPAEDASGEWDMCGRQDDHDQWLAPGYNPVVMGSLSSEVSDMPSRLHKGNDASYPHLVGGE